MDDKGIFDRLIDIVSQNRAITAGILLIIFAIIIIAKWCLTEENDDDDIRGLRDRPRYVPPKPTSRSAAVSRPLPDDLVGSYRIKPNNGRASGQWWNDPPVTTEQPTTRIDEQVLVYQAPSTPTSSFVESGQHSTTSAPREDSPSYWTEAEVVGEMNRRLSINPRYTERDALAEVFADPRGLCWELNGSASHGFLIFSLKTDPRAAASGTGSAWAVIPRYTPISALGVSSLVEYSDGPAESPDAIVRRMVRPAGITLGEFQVAREGATGVRVKGEAEIE